MHTGLRLFDQREFPKSSHLPALPVFPQGIPSSHHLTRCCFSYPPSSTRAGKVTAEPCEALHWLQPRQPFLSDTHEISHLPTVWSLPTSVWVLSLLPRCGFFATSTSDASQSVCHIQLMVPSARGIWMKWELDPSQVTSYRHPLFTPCTLLGFHTVCTSAPGPGCLQQESKVCISLGSPIHAPEHLVQPGHKPGVQLTLLYSSRHE